MAANFSPIVQRPGDPRIYLWADGRWFYYDTLQQPIGGGSMGTVYVGYSMDGRTKVAVKRVNDRYANQMSVRNRAHLEASLSFRHPNMIEMIGICEYPNRQGPIFMLSNFVSGCNIDDYIKTYNIPETNREEFISEKICKILDALEYLHYKGIIHRDIKPSNIMIDMNTDEPKLMDLGIAKMLNTKASTFGFVGTPQYAAPEQINRTEDDDTLTPAADIYALGVTFYELLSGTNPFDSEIQSNVIENALKMNLPKNRLISRKMMKVLRKATEKDYERRFQSAGEFKNAIESVLESGTKTSNNIIFIAAISLVFVIIMLLLMF
ncbi:MAG: serine/threonine protein kinase [Bacteroidales bacterium]|nr:serine/threonine protein kinase [Bacteroidales bacterium]